jgi:hypothetical protein
MIDEKELRPGNYILQKLQGRVITTKCNYQHYDLMANGGGKDLYPVVLKAQILEKCGFKENMDYALLPQAREFRLTIPVPGSHQHEIPAYIQNNQECFGRAAFNGQPASSNFYHLHQLQNLHFALTGKELEVKPL